MRVTGLVDRYIKILLLHQYCYFEEKEDLTSVYIFILLNIKSNFELEGLKKKKKKLPVEEKSAGK